MKTQDAGDTPDSLATASAAKTAVASCRVSTMRMPSFSQATKMGEMCPPTRVNTYLTPWARSTSATLSPPCRGLIVSVCRGPHGKNNKKLFFVSTISVVSLIYLTLEEKTKKHCREKRRQINRGHAKEAFLKVTCHTIRAHRCFTTTTLCSAVSWIAARLLCNPTRDLGNVIAFVI